MSATPTDGFDPTELIQHLTHRPGVYQMLDAKSRVIYVGKARDLKRRVSSYFSGRAQDAKTIALLRSVAALEVTVTGTESEALMLEYNLIKRHKPRYNVVLRDDKSYPYIRVTTESVFPRIGFYRGAKLKKGRLFGPYPNAGSVRETLSQLQKLFQLRQCEDSYFANRSRPCLQHQIHRCTAPCVGLVSEADYGRDVENAILFLQGESETVIGHLVERMEEAAREQRYERAAQYRDQVSRLRSVQSKQLVARSKGNFDVVGMVSEQGVYCVSVLYFRGGRSLGARNFFPRTAEGADDEEIIRAFLLQYYGGREAPAEILASRAVPEAAALAAMLSERAGRKVAIKWRLRGDRAQWVDMALTNARHGAALKVKSSATIAAQLEALAQALDLGEAPQRIECFDISHTAGESAVGSCVVFGPEGPLKSEYRRFNIKDVASGDDYAAMNQVLRRRYSRVAESGGPVPDLILIDGGRGQLKQAIDVLQDLGITGVRLVGVAKGEGRKPGRETLHAADRAVPVRLPPSSGALHLVQQVRDEAHRFAVAGHRARREKRRTTSPLEEIRGLGPTRRRELLRQFGGLQALAKAGVDDLARVKGISRDLAKSIYARFHAD
jgi:excinuclease ABC subunit C